MLHMSKAWIFFVVAAVAYADGPVLKEGLWSVTTRNGVNSSDEMTRSICRDHAYDAKMQEAEKAQQQRRGCKIVKDETLPTKREFEGECSINGVTAHIKRVVTFDGDSAAHSEMTTTYTPPLHGMSTMTIVMDQKYVGACPAGMNPGDIKNADGTITHPR